MGQQMQQICDHLQMTTFLILLMGDQREISLN